MIYIFELWLQSTRSQDWKQCVVQGAGLPEIVSAPRRTSQQSTEGAEGVATSAPSVEQNGGAMVVCQCMLVFCIVNHQNVVE